MYVCYAGMIRLVKICKQRQSNIYGLAGKSGATIHCIGNNDTSHFSDRYKFYATDTRSN